MKIKVNNSIYVFLFVVFILIFFINQIISMFDYLKKENVAALNNNEIKEEVSEYELKKQELISNITIDDVSEGLEDFISEKNEDESDIDSIITKSDDKIIVSYDRITYMTDEENTYINYLFDENDILEEIRLTMNYGNKDMASEIAKELENVLTAGEINVYGTRVVVTMPIPEEWIGITKDGLIEILKSDYVIEKE